MENHITIDDFDEKDFLDPISLLDALKQRSSQLNISGSSYTDGLLTLSEIQEKYGFSNEYLQSALMAGKIVPQKVVLFFNPNEIERYIAENSSSNPLMASFEKELDKMVMHYSYKPLLILSLLNSTDCRANIDDIITFYFSFYEDLKRQNRAIEKTNSSFVAHPRDRLFARRTILHYPIPILAKKSYVIYDKEADVVSLNPILSKEIDCSRREQLIQQCYYLLKKYYANI